MGNSLQNREGSSNSHLTAPLAPLGFKGKQKQIGQGRQREVFTHFVSLPLVTYPELKEKLEAFQNSILGNNNDKVLPLKFQNTLPQRGIEKSIFVSPKTFHLTVVMLRLENNESVVKAQKILKSISPNVRQALKNRPVFTRLRGLECMNGSLDKTRVLYAPVEEVGNEGRLLSACLRMLSLMHL
ncbi:PREDICTED: uncharacterized protein LOC104765458 isoform X2 [Camelina sativa]|uniref:Uncharacterized protein LOC104765458 isoform X2 n=1 Tax=Camelina sativa TaxID=90675 RepID=A0ABM1RAW8_CAMSA|nr:PREDICTED: uncharacterized protein LOC104765458 isoform X2 [Camelina sativa]